jgi:acyl carrier protein
MRTRHPDSAESTLAWLRQLVAGLLNVDEHELATDQSLGEQGIDSLTAAEFSSEIEEHTGVNVPLERFLGDHTLTDVARELAGGVFATGIDLAEVAAR